MKFLIDESVEFRIASFLAERGHDVTAIAHDYPNALADRTVLEIARSEGRILTTNDSDFGELIFREQLPHFGVVYLRFSDAGLRAHLPHRGDPGAQERERAWLGYSLCDVSCALSYVAYSSPDRRPSTVAT